jgi:NADPH:quinone reductase-like Zn-dependent oxidoreductase
VKAIVVRRYGSPDVLQCEEVEKPVPGDDEVLIRVRASSVNPVDRIFRGRPFLIRLITGLRKPKRPRAGTDVAGQVEAVGRNVTSLKPGDQVFGACRGSFAEYVCGQRLVVKPENVTFEQAAAVPVAGITALQGLRDKGQLQAGQKVLINGASGGVGTFAVQIAKALGAHVTAVCSTRNVEMVRSIGADRVIDYTRENFARENERYDLIFDCIGNHSLRACRRLLNPKGTFLIVGAPKVRTSLIHALQGLVMSWFVSQKLLMFIGKLTTEELAVLRDLMESGKVTPVIDKRYSLCDVADAMRHLEGGHASGKIVITVSS